MLRQTLLRQENRDDDDFEQRSGRAGEPQQPVERHPGDETGEDQEEDDEPAVPSARRRPVVAPVEDVVQQPDRRAENGDRMRQAPPEPVRVADSTVEQQGEEQDEEMAGHGTPRRLRGPGGERPGETVVARGIRSQAEF